MNAAAPAIRLPARSMGLKLLLVCGLALLMSIVALFVFLLLMDRSSRAEQVAREVGQVMGGEQTFLGPVLIAPYSIPPQGDEKTASNGVHVFFPETGAADVNAASEVRKRSLFKIPVYRAGLKFTADFQLPTEPSGLPARAVLDWSRAEFLVGVSDARGAQSDVTLTAAGRALPLAPATELAAIGLSEGDGDKVNDMRFFGVPAGDVARPGARFSADTQLTFSGAARLAVLPFAKATTLTMTSDWPHPSFDGGFLPADKTISADGFRARWSVPFIARGVPSDGEAASIARLGRTAMGVTFVEPANPYQSVGRSLKYAPLFLGLVFLTYFIFETLSRRRMHAAQYVLVGLAQIVFYLLLLSIAEHLGFDIAFVIAATATVSLISIYAAWVFDSRRQGVVALIAFSALYALIYVLMRLEDFALLVGALASFGAIAAVMYFTRRIDWYGAAQAEPAPATAASAKPAPGVRR